MKKLLRVLVSFIIIGIIIVNIDWSDSIETIKQGNLLLICFAVLLIFIGRLILSYKWEILLKTSRRKLISFWRLFILNYIGYFWGLILPSGISIDIVRGYYLSKDISDRVTSASSVIVDRLTGLVSLLLMCFLGILFYGHLIIDKNLKFSLLMLGAVLLFGIIVVFSKRFTFIINQKSKVLRENRIGKILLKVHHAVVIYRDYPRLLIIAFGIAVIIQVLRILIVYVISLAFYSEVPIGYYIVIVPIMYIVAMLPVAFMGIGVREGTLVAFFAYFGLSTADAFVISLTNSLLDIFVSLGGGVAYLFYRPKKLTEQEIVKG